MNQQQQQQQQQQDRCDHGEQPRLKIRKLLSPSSSELQLQLQLLPDEVLARIGESVAKLCGIRDFLRLSQTSKHFKKLLMDSEETVSNVIRMRTSRINHSTMLLPSVSSAPIAIHTLHQLEFYELCCGYGSYARVDEEEPRYHNLLERSHLAFENGRLNPFGDQIDEINFNLVEAVYRILKSNPSAYVVLDAHSSIRPGFLGAVWSSKDLGNTVGEEIREFDHLRFAKNRIRIRPWGREVASAASKSQHPYADMVQKGSGWVEIFLRMDMDADDPSKTYLELPPRPDFYQNITVPEEILYKNNNDSDSDDYDDDNYNNFDYCVYPGEHNSIYHEYVNSSSANY